MFNLVPCENDFEQAFADFCDVAGDVVAFAKNAGPQKLMIDYLKPEGNRSFYVPDFFVRVQSGDYYAVELKGKVDALVPYKAMAARQWCKAASGGKTKWRYIYVPYLLFQQIAASSLENLARACEPSLFALLEEAKTKQQELPLFEETARKKAEDLFSEACKKAGLRNVHKEVEDTLRQAVNLLDYAVRAGMPDFSHAFQPLLRPLDKYAIKILSGKLVPEIPKGANEHSDFFSPYIRNLPQKEQSLLERYQRYLRHNLVFGRPIQRLGTLLFCLEYAQKGGWGVSGIWRAVEEVFAGDEMGTLYNKLEDVNKFRNTHVAHVDTALKDPHNAWEAMRKWIGCVNLMVDFALK